MDKTAAEEMNPRELRTALGYSIGTGIGMGLSYHFAMALTTGGGRMGLTATALSLSATLLFGQAMLGSIKGPPLSAQRRILVACLTASIAAPIGIGAYLANSVEKSHTPPTQTAAEAACAQHEGIFLSFGTHCRDLKAPPQP